MEPGEFRIIVKVDNVSIDYPYGWLVSDHLGKIIARGGLCQTKWGARWAARRAIRKHKKRQRKPLKSSTTLYKWK